MGAVSAVSPSSVGDYSLDRLHSVHSRRMVSLNLGVRVLARKTVPELAEPMEEAQAEARSTAWWMKWRLPQRDLERGLHQT